MLRLSPFITVYCCAVAALLGACTGSFLACLAWRTVHGESVLRGRSHCDVCGHVLGVRDLVPVFSYLLSGGKCRYCGAKLSARHVWGELISAAVFVSLLLQNDISLQTLEAWLLACVLLACTFADLEGYIIPDRFVAAGVVLFIATLFWEPEPLRRALDGGRMESFSGKDPLTGENILAVSAPLVFDGSVVGVLRLVTATRELDKQVALLTLAFMGIAVVISGVVLFYIFRYLLNVLLPKNDMAE